MRGGVDRVNKGKEKKFGKKRNWGKTMVRTQKKKKKEL